MFSNIGGKIKTTAAVWCWLIIIASVIAAFRLMTTGGVIAGILIAVAGILTGWVSSFMLYGFGELIENSSIIANLMAKQDAEKSRKKDEE